MANVAAGLYAAGGVFPALAASGQYYREDLLDAVINLDKNKTAAIFLAAPKTTANGMNHEWLVEGLPATATGGQLEGYTWAAASGPGRIRLGNAVQSFIRPFAVTMDAVTYASKGMAPGVTQEYEHQVEAWLLNIEQSVDARLVATANAAVSASATTVSALMGGFKNWIVGTSGAAGALQGSTASTAAQAAPSNISMNIAGGWSRSRFLTLHQAMFDVGANPDTLAVASSIKSQITLDVLGETAAATAGAPPVVRQVHTDGSNSEFAQDIQFLRTDFGRVAILVDRFMPTAATNAAPTPSGACGAFYLYERARSRIAFWRPMKHYPLPTDGDYLRGYCHTGVTYEALNPMTVGIGYNIA
jgi:hypothetical protein